MQKRRSLKSSKFKSVVLSSNNRIDAVSKIDAAASSSNVEIKTDTVHNQNTLAH